MTRSFRERVLQTPYGHVMRLLRSRVIKLESQTLPKVTGIFPNPVSQNISYIRQLPKTCWYLVKLKVLRQSTYTTLLGLPSNEFHRFTPCTSGSR